MAGASFFILALGNLKGKCMNGHDMRRLLAIGVLVLAMIGFLSIDDAQARGTRKHRAQMRIRLMAQETLRHLYKIHPVARRELRKAAGYAVFDDFGAHIFFFEHGARQGYRGQQQDEESNVHEDALCRCGPRCGY
jgi:hypothetical protein